MKSIRVFSLLAAFVLATVALLGCMPIQAPIASPAPTVMDDSNIIQATFVCPDGTELPAAFDNNNHTVTVQLPDGEVTLPQAESASGARYSDDTTTFWNKGDEAMVEINGEIVYQNCVAK